MIIPPLHSTVLQLPPSITAGKEANQNIHSSDKVKRDELLTLFARWSMSYWGIILSKTTNLFYRTRFYKHQTFPWKLCDPFFLNWNLAQYHASRHIAKHPEYRNRVLCSIYSGHKRLSGRLSFRISAFEIITCISFHFLLWF